MSTTISNVTKAQRWRSRAVWAFIIGGIGYSGCVLGLVQYMMTGSVSIRIGHEPVEGETAIWQLIFIGSISSIFCAFGIFSKFFARRQTIQRGL
jgi:hypothetical protein